jgi:hypothetical protein
LTIGGLFDDLAAGERDRSAGPENALIGDRPPQANARGEDLERDRGTGVHQHFPANRRDRARCCSLARYCCAFAGRGCAFVSHGCAFAGHG